MYRKRDLTIDTKFFGEEEDFPIYSTLNDQSSRKIDERYNQSYDNLTPILSSNKQQGITKLQKIMSQIMSLKFFNCWQRLKQNCKNTQILTNSMIIHDKYQPTLAENMTGQKNKNKYRYIKDSSRKENSYRDTYSYKSNHQSNISDNKNKVQNYLLELPRSNSHHKFRIQLMQNIVDKLSQKKQNKNEDGLKSQVIIKKLSTLQRLMRDVKISNQNSNTSSQSKVNSNNKEDLNIIMQQLGGMKQQIKNLKKQTKQIHHISSQYTEIKKNNQYPFNKSNNIIGNKSRQQLYIPQINGLSHPSFQTSFKNIPFNHQTTSTGVSPQNNILYYKPNFQQTKPLIPQYLPSKNVNQIPFTQPSYHYNPNEIKNNPPIIQPLTISMNKSSQQKSQIKKNNFQNEDRFQYAPGIYTTKVDRAILNKNIKINNIKESSQCCCGAWY